MRQALDSIHWIQCASLESPLIFACIAHVAGLADEWSGARERTRNPANKPACPFDPNGLDCVGRSERLGGDRIGGLRAVWHPAPIGGPRAHCGVGTGPAEPQRG